MRTSSRLPALWSFGSFPISGFYSGRYFAGLWLLLWMSLGSGLGLLAAPGCTPGHSNVDENTSPPDLAMGPLPPPPCQKDRLRCSADKDATEICDGMTWKRRDPCDTA